MAGLTPMMQKYMETKEEYSDCILFYRLGDFYEMFFEDAKIVSKELELTLTGKSCGLEKRAPMCGVPYHAAETYLNRLVQKGYKVAICEQVEDPKQAKGLVKREVIRVVTPGTTLDPAGLDETKNNYIMGIFCDESGYGLAIADITTADFFVTEVDSVRKLKDELSKFTPSEIVCNASFLISGIDIQDLEHQYSFIISSLEDWFFTSENVERTLLSHFHAPSFAALGLSDFPIGAVAAGALFQYLLETQKTGLEHISKIEPYLSGKYMLLDAATRRNLELTDTLREKQKRGSLLWVLDKTKTAMGARLLRSYVEQPLISKCDIEMRLDAVDVLYHNMIAREEIREYLQPVYDLERLITRIVYGTANPRDFIAFKNSIRMLPSIKMILSELDGVLLKEINENMDELTDICDLIEESITEEPPITVRDAGILKSGYNHQVDELRSAKTDGKQWLSKIEEEEREKTGIKNLRIKYNKVFGYYLEVTNSYRDLVPEYYTRKQTLTNAERYITPKLKELEDKILGAEDKLTALEYEIFCSIRDQVASHAGRIQKTAKQIAMLDVFTSLAYVSEGNGYVRPRLNEIGTLELKEGRHPVVEQMSGNLFIPNDVYLDNEKDRISIITGPNMAGKSTYMRQVALIVLMAQIGCFVPCQSADIGVVDRIFTRVGASDDLASGQSTFMVEMTEVANILRNASKRSLLILDEIGRGTSTLDGLSIAWAVVEYISNPNLIGAKTLFATHYHELTELEGKIEGVQNYCIAVQEKEEDIVFLRKIIKGGADKSYGIQVAKLAGVPDVVIQRARKICEELEGTDLSEIVKQMDVETETELKQQEKTTGYEQLSLFSEEDTLRSRIRSLDITNMTPIEAINELYQLQARVKEGK